VNSVYAADVGYVSSLVMSSLEGLLMKGMELRYQYCDLLRPDSVPNQSGHEPGNGAAAWLLHPAVVCHRFIPNSKPPLFLSPA